MSRVLFWTSPVFGRQGVDGIPPDEIVAAMAWLLGWSPRGSWGHRVADTASRWLRVTLLVAGTYVALSPELATRWLPTLPMIQRHPGAWAVSVVLGCAVLYALWTALRRQQPRRPILLVIDGLDKCRPEQVVELLETVRTLRRELAETRLLPVGRRPAPLMVLVRADKRELKRKLRAALKTKHEAKSFLREVFDDIKRMPR